MMLIKSHSLLGLIVAVMFLISIDVYDLKINKVSQNNFIPSDVSEHVEVAVDYNPSDLRPHV